jgi:cell division protein FtsQ
MKALEKNLIVYSPERTSAILAKQKSRESSRLRSYWRRIVLIFKWTGICTGVLSLVIAVFWIRYSILHSQKFEVAVKDIQGLHYVSESQVLIKVAEFEGRNHNLLSLDLEGLRKSLEQIPWVSEAVVRRSLPNRLNIDIRERQPMAFAKVSNTTLLVDEEGILLERTSEMASEFDFPVIVGLEAGFDSDVLARNRQRLKRYQGLIRSLDENGASLSKDLSEIYLQDPEDVSVILNDDTVLVHLGENGYPQKFRHYLAMSKELKQKYHLLDSVDLRFQNQVIVNTENGTVPAGNGGP